VGEAQAPLCEVCLAEAGSGQLRNVEVFLCDACRAAPPPVSSWQLRRAPATPDAESDEESAVDAELEKEVEALGERMRMSPENP
jgi:hypothetical protein